MAAVPCEVCRGSGGRYKCPCCGTRSCSLPCVRRHKTELGCSGKRCKTEYVKISNFSTSHLISDYRFLEEVYLLVDSSQRGWRELHSSSGRCRDGRRHRQTQLMRVQSMARKRDIHLLLLPQGMQRHQLNTSCTVWNEERSGWTIEWRVQLVFPCAGLDYTQDRVPESQLLRELLLQYIHPTTSKPLTRHRLGCYVHAVGDSGSLEAVSVFMKLEKSKGLKFQELDVMSSLCDNMRQKQIVEFPELHVVLKSSQKIEKYLGNDREETIEEDVCTVLTEKKVVDSTPVVDYIGQCTQEVDYTGQCTQEVDYTGQCTQEVEEDGTITEARGGCLDTGQTVTDSLQLLASAYSTSESEADM